MWITNILVNKILWISLYSLVIITDAQWQQQNSRQLNVQPLNNNNNKEINNFNNSLINPEIQTAIGQEAFALNIYYELVRHLENIQFNLVISPFSIWSLLVLITEGSSGKTNKELKNILGLPNDLTYVQEPYRQIQNFLKLKSENTEINTAQVFIFDRKLVLEPNFINKIKGTYSSDLLPVDFQNTNDALYRIENYMKNNTNGKIEKILTEEELKDAQIVMISAIIFESQWMSPFNKSFTREETFYDGYGNPNGTVNMMFQRNAFPYTAMAELDSHLLELPYGSGNLSMILLLPRKDVTIQMVVNKLKNIPLSKIFEELHKAEIEFEDDEVEVHIPRFTVTSDLSLQAPLEELGLSTLFQPNEADLSKISVNPIFLTQLIHKVTITVDEEGTVASAVTAGIFANKATPPRFYANRPFLYMIVEKRTNTMLFLGQLQDPAQFKL